MLSLELLPTTPLSSVMVNNIYYYCNQLPNYYMSTICVYTSVYTVSPELFVS